jgi:haloalkane dehalogenase
MDVLTTPDSRFENLAGYPFAPHYLEVAASDTQPLRMHYVDEGRADGPPIVLLHGEPTWSYLYRTMIPPLADGGHRVLAPDLIGFGRSDKPSRIGDYSYLRHVEWVTSWLEHLDLRDVTLFGQDWGSLIGLRIAAEQSDRIARIVVANGFLPTAQRRTPPAFYAWRAFARYSPVLPAGRLVAAGTVPANRAAWEALGRWEKPFLAVFGARDPILGRADRPLIGHVPGAAGQPHARINGGHFVQEDCGPELAARILSWEQARR